MSVLTRWLRTPPGRWPWQYPTLLVTATAWALLAAVWPAPAPLPDAVWVRAERAVDAAFEPGDAVLVLPAWLPGAARRFPGQPLLLGPPISAAEAQRFRRFLIVSAGGTVPDGLVPLAGAPARDLDGLTLRLARAAGEHEALPDLLARLPEARVTLVRGATTQACGQWRDGAWQCPGPDWNHVGPVQQAIAGQARTCLWAHPRSGHDLVVTFPGVLLRDGLAGHYGLSDEAARTPGGQPVRFAVDVDGREVLHRTAPNAVGWRAFRIPATEIPPGVHDVSFHVTTDHDGRRHFCFTADLGTAP